MRRPYSALLLSALTTAAACRDKVPLGSLGTVELSTDVITPPGAGGNSAESDPSGPTPETDTTTPSAPVPSPTPDSGDDASPDAPSDAGASDGGATPSDAGSVAAFPACGQPTTPGPLNAAGVGGFGPTELLTDWIRPMPSPTLSWELMVEQDVPERGPNQSPVTGYYWANHFFFEGGVDGVFGLQTEGFYQADVPTGEFEFTKIAVFWLSGPPLDAELGDIPYPDARVASENAAGATWTTIHARFEWEECHVYLLSVAPQSTEDDGSLWYGAWIEDLNTGERILLGRMLLPSDVGMISTFSTSRTFPIDFGTATDCSVHQYASALIGAPNGEGGISSLLQSRVAEPARCPTSRATPFERAVRHELGVRE